jgi:hypothetical protein
MAKKKTPLSFDELCEKVDALQIPESLPATDDPARAFFIGLKSGFLKKWGGGFVVLGKQQFDTTDYARTIYEYIIKHHKKPTKASTDVSSKTEDVVEPPPGKEQSDD